jgi:lipopolysaccharide transport system ATP-binding protein
MKPILEVKNISKKFKIGHNQQGYLSLRESLSSLLSTSSQKSEDFWALKDISFNVHSGECIGIIGRNGAGKSTLLKILSKITPPTSGKIISRGRIASLLEVGTGFHPELTGRENVFLNGSLLGMKRGEILKKFDEIVEFSGVELFLDTPLKRYSSGMQLRLAFAVAVFLEPEILIIDEVLAVGDSIFQQKCINKMFQLSNSGVNIILVSHNLQSVKALCSRALFLQDGKFVLDGDVDTVINEYQKIQTSLSGKEIDLISLPRKEKDSDVIFKKITFPNDKFEQGENLSFIVELHSISGLPIKDIDFGFSISDNNNQILMHYSNRFLNMHLMYDPNNNERFKLTSTCNLRPGVYNITLFLRVNDKIQDWLKEQIKIEINDGNPYNYFESGMIQGLVFPEFNIEKL